ncbi:MAG TPA: tetratricopeptide repeat protein [Thiotrichaceae bacterium]|nr:tetratricopeptide repeat protein [Thiotrichaceae bacterium]
MADWGLLRLHPDVIILQSAFVDFLGSRLAEKAEWQGAIEMAFDQYYDYDKPLKIDFPIATSAQDLINLFKQNEQGFNHLEKGLEKVRDRIITSYPIDPKWVHNNLPITGQHLFGRKGQIQQLDDAWNDPNIHIISLVAWAGVGKTALVKYWLQKMERVHYRGAKRVYAITFYSQGTSDKSASAEPFIDKALRWFGDLNPTEGTSEERGERLARLIKSERSLLLLDGIESLQHPPGPNEGAFKEKSLKALIVGLATYNPGLCVMTTRLPIKELEAFESHTSQQISLKNLKLAEGVELLRSLGVKGDDNELEQATTEFNGHCFALTLLGSYISDAYDGDIRCRVEIGPLEEDERQGGHARRIMEAYEKWFEEGPMLDILLMLGLFNQPADADCIKALRTPPVIRDLTDNLMHLSTRDWQRTLNKLRRSQLLTEQNPKEKGTLDSHPLVREHFGSRLRERSLEAWREGHKRLYEYLKNKTPKLPDTLDEMMPLYRAIVHGCYANKYQESFDEIYWARVQRGPKKYFSTDQLGAFYTDLSVLTHFFTEPWYQAVTNLNKYTIATIQNKVGFCLKALGRFEEAIEPIQAALEGYKEQQAWKEATGVASNLGYRYLWSGEIKKAVEMTQKGVFFADKINEQDKERMLMRTRSRTAWADMLHHAGNFEEAQKNFQAAEAIQREDKRQPSWLYAAQSFRYCDLLLSQQKYQEVKKRAFRALDIAERSRKKRPFEIALHNINLGRAFHLAGEYEVAVSHLENALTNLEVAKRLDTLPVALIARAALRRYLNKIDDAYADIDHAMKIAERGQMKLHMADCYLEYARLDFVCGKEFLQNLKNAKTMIIEMNYHRRDNEVNKLEKM